MQLVPTLSSYSRRTFCSVHGNVEAMEGRFALTINNVQRACTEHHGLSLKDPEVRQFLRNVRARFRGSDSDPFEQFTSSDCSLSAPMCRRELFVRRGQRLPSSR
jgi:hypothetical protein